MILHRFHIILFSKTCRNLLLMLLDFLNPIQDEGMERRGGGEGTAKPPYQFFSCNFYKRRNQPLKLSDFQFQPLCHTGVKFQGHTQCQSQIIELQLTAPLKKLFFLVNLYKIDVMITSLIEMLELPNFDHMINSTI